MKRMIVANWKMNPKDFASAEKLFSEVKETAKKLTHVETVIAPPFVYLPEIAGMYTGHRISFSGQDVFWEKKGSFTGEVSVSMLKDSGAEYCIVGHSERRALGESDEEVNGKLIAVLGGGLTAILCIGEAERNHNNGTHLEFLTNQLTSALSNVPSKYLARLVVAYEPIWAIGKTDKDAISSHELHETVLLIKKVITRLYEKKSADKVRVLYGGSVERENAEALLSEGTVDGFLVGHASLDSKEFSEILRIAEKI